MFDRSSLGSSNSRLFLRQVLFIAKDSLCRVLNFRENVVPARTRSPFRRLVFMVFGMVAERVMGNMSGMHCWTVLLGGTLFGPGL